MRLTSLFRAPAVALMLCTAATAAEPPVGVFLFYPQEGGAPTSADCEALVREVKPSVEKAEAWRWGRAPMGADLEFYLFLDRDRMEPTYAAEGDYDSGTVRWGETRGGETGFDLVPDDHPEVTIKGSVQTRPGSPVVAVTLRGVPSSEGKQGRTSYFCRFEDEMRA